MASAKAGTMRRDAGQLAEGNWRGGRRRFISYAGQMNKHKNKPSQFTHLDAYLVLGD